MGQQLAGWAVSTASSTRKRQRNEHLPPQGTYIMCHHLSPGSRKRRNFVSVVVIRAGAEEDVADVSGGRSFGNGADAVSISGHTPAEGRVRGPPLRMPFIVVRSIDQMRAGRGGQQQRRDEGAEGGAGDTGGGGRPRRVPAFTWRPSHCFGTSRSPIVAFSPRGGSTRRCHLTVAAQTRWTGHEAAEKRA